MKQARTESSFVTAVEQALKHFSDSTWLGENSPLASPYFLGAWLSTKATHADARGRVLQELLRSTTSKISGRYHERYKMIIQEYYFQERALDVVCDTVGLGRNSFHLSRNDAIRTLADLLAVQINPALRLESPPQPPPLLERESQLSQGLAAIDKLQTIMLTGSGGSGKTSLGSMLAARSNRLVFWFTIRPSLNDSLEALLFALGCFLHAHGSSSLWLELVATSDKFKPDRMVSIARFAIERLRPQYPLICIDEADLLTPSTDPNHVPIVKFLESLHGLTPLLLVGQRPLLDADFFCSLTGLSLSGTEQLFLQEDISLTRLQLREIHTISQGNPRLLELLVALYTAGEPIEETMTELSQQPSIEFLLSRILQRLDEQACSILMELAVFRRPAPIDLWGSGQIRRSLQQLVSLHLAQLDQHGGVGLLPAYRNTIYQLLPEEKRNALHARAAAVRSDYGDFAAALYHLIQSGQVEPAIWLWHEHRQSAINQGQAQTGLTLLRSIRSMSLTPLARETVELLCAELERLTGNAAKAQKDIHTILWQTPILSIDANHLAGLISNDQSEFDGAESAFRRALKTAETIVETRLSHIHRGLGARFLAERDIEQANYEARRARYEVEQLDGDIAFEIGHYARAEEHYQAAMTIAEELDYQEGVAKTSTVLAWIYILRGDRQKFESYINKAEASYKHLGKIVQQISLQINWMLAHNLMGTYANAISTALDTQKRLAQLGTIPPRQQALLALGLAEAHLGLNELDNASNYVREVIEIEEITALPDAYLTYGTILRRQGHTASALKFVRDALNLAIENEELFLQGYIWREMGIIYSEIDNPAEAENAFTNAIELFENMGLQNEVEKTQKQAKLQTN